MLKLKISLLLVLSIVLSGCAPILLGAAAGAGGAYYFKDRGEATFDYSVKEVYQTSLEVLKENKAKVKIQTQNSKEAKIEGHFVDQVAFRIKIEKSSDIDSKIEVRIWKAKNSDRADELLDDIRYLLTKKHQ